MTYIERNSNELYHHGIKGQKWGKRRFQNSDGTLTKEGKARYKAYNKDYKEYKTLNRHVSASQRHLKEEGVMLDRVRDKYQQANKAYAKEMSKSSGLFGLRAADKAEKVARAQSALDAVGKDYDTAATAYGYANRLAKKDRKALTDHVSNMINKYGKGSVKEIEYETVKIGQNKLQKILQGAPVSSVFGRERETDTFVKTGKTVADMPVIGNWYTANYTSDQEWKMKRDDIERIRNDNSTKRQLNGKKGQGPAYLTPGYFEGTSSLSTTERTRIKETKKAEKEAKKAEKEAKKLKDADDKTVEAVTKLAKAINESDKKTAKAAEDHEKTQKMMSNEADKAMRYAEKVRKREAKKEAKAAKAKEKQFDKFEKHQRKKLADLEKKRQETAKDSSKPSSLSQKKYGYAIEDGKTVVEAHSQLSKEEEEYFRNKGYSIRYSAKHSATYRARYSDELYHYGVIGMKWGIHKAVTYATDVNKHRYKQKVKALDKKDKNYKQSKKQLRAELERENQKAYGKIGKTKIEKGKAVKSIYQKYKDTAIKEIPHYKLKRGAKVAAKTLGLMGLTGIGVLTSLDYGRSSRLHSALADVYTQQAKTALNKYFEAQNSGNHARINNAYNVLDRNIRNAEWNRSVARQYRSASDWTARSTGATVAYLATNKITKNNELVDKAAAEEEKKKKK